MGEYRDPGHTAVKNSIEENPYSFEPYDSAIGCFQISCYQIAQSSINRELKTKLIRNGWEYERMDNSEFNMHLYFATKYEQALIAKYIYSKNLEGSLDIQEQLKLVDKVLDSICVIPEEDRIIAYKLINMIYSYLH